MQQQPRERSSQAAAAAAGDQEFAAVLAPLEAETGKRLNGIGRGWCRAAFEENPGGFGRIADDALAKAQLNPLGLLVRMVRDGDHRLPAPSPLTDDETARLETARVARSRAESPRRTGWRYVRGTHSATYVPDPEGTDRPPAGAS